MPGRRNLRGSFVLQPIFCALVAFSCWSCCGGSSAPPPPPPPPPTATFELVQVATGFSNPLDIQQPDDNSGRLFVVEQGGHIQIILFTVDQPFPNHKGGGLAFGKDGFLYIGLGDGGSGGDPLGNGQNTNTLLGKMLRIDVDSAHSPGLNYAIPPSNPFVTSGGRAEIWVYGLRNPFRFSFDSVTGDLWIGDVGQDKFEEVDRLTSNQAGANLGWNIMEGTHCFIPATGCSTAGLTLPVFDYDHTQGDETVIGGQVYHGTKMPALAGAYVFGDFISGRMWILTQSGSTFTRTLLFNTAANDVSSIVRDQLGELYVARYSR